MEARHFQRRQVCFQAARDVKDPFEGRILCTGSEFLLTAEFSDPEAEMRVKDRFLALKQKFAQTHLKSWIQTVSQEDRAILDYVMENLECTTDMKLVLQSSRDDITFVLADGTPGFGLRRLIHAAHFLPHVPKNHKCSRLHGHTFDLRFFFQSKSAFDRFKFQESIDRFNRCLLNEIPGLENPTSELFAIHLYETLQDEFKGLLAVEVYETDNSGCLYTGNSKVQTFKRFDLQSASPAVAGGYEGYSYEMIPVISMPVHQQLGWTMDFSELKKMVEPLRKILDHHDLSKSTGMDLSRPQDLQEFLFKQLRKDLPQLVEIRLRKSRAEGWVIRSSTDRFGGDFETAR